MKPNSARWRRPNFMTATTRTASSRLPNRCLWQKTKSSASPWANAACSRLSAASRPLFPAAASKSSIRQAPAIASSARSPHNSPRAGPFTMRLLTPMPRRRFACNGWARRRRCRRETRSSPLAVPANARPHNHSGLLLKATAKLPDRNCTAYGSRRSPGRRDSTELLHRGLEIEAEIRRLFRRDRPVHAENLPSEHVVRGVVDGFDADQHALLVAEGGERA